MSATKQNHIDQLAVPLRTVVFGGNLPNMDLSDLRAEQSEQTWRSTFVQLGSMLVGAGGIIADNLSSQPKWLLAAYGGAVIAALMVRFMLAEKRRSGWIYSTPGFVAREVTLGSVTGIILAAPMAWFAWTGDAGAASNAWLIVIAMMALMAIARPRFPSCSARRCRLSV